MENFALIRLELCRGVVFALIFGLALAKAGGGRRARERAQGKHEKRLTECVFQLPQPGTAMP